MSAHNDPLHIARYKFAANYVEKRIVLDVGCGDGYGTEILAQKADRVIGIDADGRELDRAQERLAAVSNAACVYGDAREIRLIRDTVDAVVALEVIEHFIEQERFLAELKRVAKPDAVIIISTPNHTVNMKTGTYHERGHDGHGHPGELTFEEFDTLVRNYFTDPVYYGQGFLVAEPKLRHRLVNLAKRLDVFHLRRQFLKEDLREKVNLSASLLDETSEPELMRGRQASQMLVVCRNA